MKINFRFILILIGCCILTAALGFKIVNYVEVYKSEKKLQVKLEQSSNEEGFDYESLASGEEFGRLLIPALNIEGVMVEGINEENLKHNIGHFPETAMPGEKGNFTIAGHRGTVESSVFNDLNRIKAEDDIVVEALNGTFVYKVVEKFIVDPYETDVLSSTPGKKEITIVTCTLDGKERLIVKGILFEEEKE